MRHELYRQVTGEIQMTAVYDSNGNVINVIYEWRDGDVIGISEELLNNLDERYAQRDGDFIQFGPYKVEIFVYLHNVPGYGSMVLARRVYTESQ